MSVVYELVVIAAGWDHHDTVAELFLQYQVEYIVLLAIALLIDGLVYSWFGNTPGKALLGLSVVDSTGKRLSPAEYRERNFRLWAPGLGFGFLPLSLIAQSISYRKYKQDGYTAWDLEKGYVVRRGRMQAWKIVIFIAVMTGWQMIARVQTQELMRAKAQGAASQSSRSAQAVNFDVSRGTTDRARSPVPTHTETTTTDETNTPWEELQKVSSAAAGDGSASRSRTVWLNPTTGIVATLPEHWTHIRYPKTTPEGFAAFTLISVRDSIYGEMAVVVFEKTDVSMSLEEYAYHLLLSPVYLGDGPLAHSVRELSPAQAVMRKGRAIAQMSGLGVNDSKRREFHDLEVFKGVGGYWSVFYSATMPPGDPLVRGMDLTDSIAYSASR
jgi:hypothetical protein